MAECGTCTLCCELLNIPWMNSPAGEACSQCNIGVGCKVYDNIPNKCKKYQCAYVQMEKVAIKFRPDKCGVIFELIGDNVFHGLLKPNKTVEGAIERQIGSFLQEGFSVIISSMTIKQPVIYAAKAHSNAEVFELYKKAITKYAQ